MRQYLTVFLILFTPVLYAGKETELTQQWCAKHGGQTEVRHDYNVGGKKRYIKVDCETRTHVIEAGLDKRSSLDSIQQAVFASILTKKKPAVLIFDAKKGEGAIEYRIRTVAEKLGIEFIWVVDW